MEYDSVEQKLLEQTEHRSWWQGLKTCCRAIFTPSFKVGIATLGSALTYTGLEIFTLRRFMDYVGLDSVGFVFAISLIAGSSVFYVRGICYARAFWKAFNKHDNAALTSSDMAEQPLSSYRCHSLLIFILKISMLLTGIATGFYTFIGINTLLSIVNLDYHHLLFYFLSLYAGITNVAVFFIFPCDHALSNVKAFLANYSKHDTIGALKQSLDGTRLLRAIFSAVFGCGAFGIFSYFLTRSSFKVFPLFESWPIALTTAISILFGSTSFIIVLLSKSGDLYRLDFILLMKNTLVAYRKKCSFVLITHTLSSIFYIITYGANRYISVVHAAEDFGVDRNNKALIIGNILTFVPAAMMQEAAFAPLNMLQAYFSENANENNKIMDNIEDEMIGLENNKNNYESIHSHKNEN